jgi:tetratricopeptide (TPR) repeat protein
LKCHAELAELDWRHGDRDSRDAAIRQLQAVVNAYRGIAAGSEEFAALMYQLGAALVVAVRREEAEPILLDGIAIATTPYWKMRLTNALSSAQYYRGDFAAALKSSDEAWRFAEICGNDEFRARLLSNRAGIHFGLGRFRDAVELHTLSARRAQQVQNGFEYSAAAAGAAVSLNYLGEYEEAIRLARKARRAAEALPSYQDVHKGIEMEAIARFYIGDLGAARACVAAASSMPGAQLSEVNALRFDWLLARIESECANHAKAIELLERAFKTPAEAQDWEDSPGLRIELQLIQARARSEGFTLDALVELVSKVMERGSPVVQLQGTLALAEVSTMYDGHREEVDDLISRGTTVAERCMAREHSWRINFWAGERLLKQEQRRHAHSRFSHAVRIFRDIAERLELANRTFYLETPCARRLSERASGSD